MMDLLLKSVGAAAIVAVLLTAVNWWAPEIVKRYIGQLLPMFIFFFFYYQVLLVSRKIDEIKKALDKRSKE